MLIKIGRYLRGQPRLVIKFPWQVAQTVVTGYTDSDRAGCAKTARSTSGGVIAIGSHVIKTYSRQQKVVALSSAEAELYAMVAASAETLAIKEYAKDLGMTFDGEVYTDSSAALGISQRVGLGKVRHLRTQGLWLQEARATGRLTFKKVLGSKNPSDVLTKHVAADLLDKHMQTIGATIVGGRAELAPELNLVESLVNWYEHVPEKKVSFSKKVSVRAIPSENRGRPCGREAGRDRWQGPRGSNLLITAAGETETVAVTRPRWADMADEEEAVQSHTPVKQTKLFEKNWSRRGASNSTPALPACARTSPSPWVP